MQLDDLKCYNATCTAGLGLRCVGIAKRKDENVDLLTFLISPSLFPPHSERGRCEIRMLV
jgi:hypothetical protein